MHKFILILLTGLSLTGCAETGRLLGTITMVPVRVISGTVNYDHSTQAQDISIDINQAKPLNAQ